MKIATLVRPITFPTRDRDGRVIGGILMPVGTLVIYSVIRCTDTDNPIIAMRVAGRPNLRTESWFSVIKIVVPA